MSTIFYRGDATPLTMGLLTEWVEAVCAEGSSSSVSTKALAEDTYTILKDAISRGDLEGKDGALAISVTWSASA